MVLADGQGTPLGGCAEQAPPADVTCLERTLNSLNMKRRRGQRRRPPPPERLLADRGYTSNQARALLATGGIAPIIPRRENNRVATHQDRRKLRRYRRRGMIERTNAWLQNFRRLVVHYEHHVKLFEALVRLACALGALKKVSR